MSTPYSDVASEHAAFNTKSRQRIQQTEFMTSAPTFRLCPPDAGLEIAFAGRSNAGKSSAINALTNQRQLARSSKTPGRTQMIDQQANVLGFLFGNLLELDWADLPTLAVSVLIGLALLVYIWPAQVKLATHEALARIQGVNPTRQRLFFMGVLAGFCAIALQAVGSLLISGLLVLPALSARLWTTSPKQMVIFALIIAQFGVTLGVWGSVWMDIQTGLSIVLVLAILFFIALLLSRLLTRLVLTNRK